jgi:hypothetical protein
VLVSQHGEAGLHGRKEPADGQPGRQDGAAPVGVLIGILVGPRRVRAGRLPASAGHHQAGQAGGHRLHRAVRGGGPAGQRLGTAGRLDHERSAKVDSGTVVLTTASKEQTGTCVFGTPLIAKGPHASFTIQISGGTGGDGVTFMLLDAASAKPTALGAGGGGMGFAGLPGVAVAFTTYGQPGDPSNNFVGVSSGGNGRNLKYLATSTNVPNLRSGTHACRWSSAPTGRA